MLKRFFLAASLFIFCTPTLVSACSCGIGGGPCDQSWNYGQVIFIGTVTRELLPTDVFSRKVFQLNVSESFRGPAIPGQEVAIYTGAGGGDCGYQFKIGTSYIVYAHPVGDRLTTSICSRTSPVAQAPHIIRQLRAVQKHERASDLFGVIRKYTASYAGEPAEIIPLEGRRVRVLGSNDFERSTTTDQEGVYSFPALPAGKYRIEVEPPPGMSSWHMNRGELQTVEIGARELPGCMASPFFAAEARIKGRVEHELGYGLAGVITLEPAGEKEAEMARRHGGLISVTTETGDFELWVAVTGRYRLSYRPKYEGLSPVTSDIITVTLGVSINDFLLKVPK